MRKKLIDKIRDNVKMAYEAISSEFDQTRKTKWPEFEHFLEYVGNGAKVLDLGCGNGRLYDSLKSKKVDYTGMDLSSALIDRARANFPAARFKMGDMVNLDLPDENFDIVFSIASFHHLPGRKLREKAVEEINRVLKPNGILILTVWNLFQWKYMVHIIKSAISFLFHLGLKYAWNDLWVKWGDCPLKRYYHAFLPAELVGYFKGGNWKTEEFYFTKKGTRVKFMRSYNLCLIIRKTKK